MKPLDLSKEKSCGIHYIYLLSKKLPLPQKIFSMCAIQTLICFLYPLVPNFSTDTAGINLQITGFSLLATNSLTTNTHSLTLSLSLSLSLSLFPSIKGKLQKFSVCSQFLQALTFNNQSYCAIYCSIFVGSNANKRSTVRFKNVRYSQIPRSFHNISISRLMNLFMILIPSVVFSVFHIAHQFHFLLSYWCHDPWRRRLP